MLGSFIHFAHLGDIFDVVLGGGGGVVPSGHPTYFIYGF